MTDRIDGEESPAKSPDGKRLPDLYGADPDCEHDIRPAPGGGVKCIKCPGWFCY